MLMLHLAGCLLALTSSRWIFGDGLEIISTPHRMAYLNSRCIFHKRSSRRGRSSGSSSSSVNSGNVLQNLAARRHRSARLYMVPPPTEQPPSRLHHRPPAKAGRRGTKAAAAPAAPAARFVRKQKKSTATKVVVVEAPSKPPPRRPRFWTRPGHGPKRPSPPPVPSAVAATTTATASGAVSAQKTPPAPAGPRPGGGRAAAVAAAAAAAASVHPRHSRALPRPAGQNQRFGTAVGGIFRRRQDNNGDIDSSLRGRSSRRAAPPQAAARAGRRRSPSGGAAAAAAGAAELFTGAFRGVMLLERCFDESWVGKASAHVLAGALASSCSVVAGLVVGVAVWASCAKRLTGGKDDWKQVARITAEVALLWYCHALPHGLGAARPLRGNYGTGKAGDLLGACWYFLGQGAFIRLVAASSRLVNLNVLEANGLLLGLSHLGNAVAGSRMRRIAGPAGEAAAEAHTYQLRGFFSRTNGIFGERPVLSLPFDSADTFLALQGILSATEREVVQKNGVLASAFREFAAQAANTFDAHSLGAVGARNLMGMGFISARVRMFGRPALHLGWTEKASNMCMVGDPICGSLFQKLLDPTCVILKGRGHLYDAYLACVGCG